MKNKGIGDHKKNVQPHPAVSCSRLAVAIFIGPGRVRVFGWCEATLDVYLGVMDMISRPCVRIGGGLKREQSSGVWRTDQWRPTCCCCCHRPAWSQGLILPTDGLLAGLLSFKLPHAICPSIYLSIVLSVLSVCLSICLSVCLSIYRSICSIVLSIILSVVLSFYLSIVLSVYPSIHQSIHPSIHLSTVESILLSTHQSI